MAEHDQITSGEFTRFAASIERQIQSGFEGVNHRLDHFDATVRAHGERLATVEERTHDMKRSAQGWSAGISTLISALVSGLMSAFGR